MRWRRTCRSWGWLLAAFALSTGNTQTPDASPGASENPDIELLEFLGSLDTEDGELIDDLTETDVGKPATPPPARRAPEVKSHD